MSQCAILRPLGYQDTITRVEVQIKNMPLMCIRSCLELVMSIVLFPRLFNTAPGNSRHLKNVEVRVFYLPNSILLYKRDAILRLILTGQFLMVEENGRSSTP